MKYGIDQQIIDESLRGIGEYMKVARKERGFSQEQLAEKMGMSVFHLNRCENGRISYSMTFFVSWCAHLRLNPCLVPKEMSAIRVQKLLGLEDKGKEN